ncbi:MAG: hypothetical protein U1F52_14960 [Burkholderiales bacterium]
MDAELIALDERIRQLITLAERLRADNIDLRQQLATVQGENRQLREKVTGARERLEGLLARIPQDAD